jgi:hypothetical protein
LHPEVAIHTELGEIRVVVYDDLAPPIAHETTATSGICASSPPSEHRPQLIGGERTTIRTRNLSCR